MKRKESIRGEKDSRGVMERGKRVGRETDEIPYEEGGMRRA